MKGFKRIISFSMAFAMACTIFMLPAKADYSTSTTDTLWGSYIRAGVNSVQDVPIIGTMLGYVVGWSSGRVCAASDDQLHHADSYESCAVDKDGTPYVSCICKYCGDRFKAVASDLSAAYDDYVETLPAPGYNSAGKLFLSSSHDFCYIECDEGGVANNYVYRYCEHYSGSLSSNGEVYPSGSTGEDKHYLFRLDCASSSITLTPLSGKTTFGYRTGRSAGFFFYFSAIAPVDGFYSVLSGPACSVDFFASDGRYGPTISVGETEVAPSFRLEFGNFLQVEKFYSKGDKISFSFSVRESAGGRFLSVRAFTPVLQVVPVSALSGDIYNTTTRPTSITGGNYGIVGDNGQIVKVEDNSTIINETNNTYYNPATGTTVPITNWSYDYSDRSYKVTLESGDTATITYGDENITIQEGDTVYNVYYLVDGSGSPPCEHDWQEGEATAPTCVRPGSASYACSKCQQTKTESIPALGHNWQVKQTVTTQYDDTGQLVQAGYTIFECSTCHEQYKSTDGTAPPVGGSGTDPGEEEEGEGFLSWLFGKIGELLGTIGDGILNLLKTALDKIFGGLIDLVNSLFENLAKLVDLFGSVGEAFQVLWTWLPPEITAILVAGVSIFVFVALLKFFMK